MNFEFLLMTERSRRVKHDNALSEGTAKHDNALSEGTAKILC